MNKPVLQISNADVYRGANKVFNKLSLTLNQNENTAILGANGAGKTTLLKLITREIYPVDREDSSISLFGEERIHLWELRQKIGVVSHDFQKNYEALATGLDVVISAFFGSIGLHGHNQVTQKHIDQAEAIIKKLGLENIKGKQYLQLSTGQQRRLLLARALIHNPKALIFDEPTSGLDIKASFKLLQDLSNLTHQNKTLILVTHHVEEIIPEIERVILLKEGKIFKDGKKEEVMTSQNIGETFDINVDVSCINGHYRITPV